MFCPVFLLFFAVAFFLFFLNFPSSFFGGGIFLLLAAAAYFLLKNEISLLRGCTYKKHAILCEFLPTSVISLLELPFKYDKKLQSLQGWWSGNEGPAVNQPRRKWSCKKILRAPKYQGREKILRAPRYQAARRYIGPPKKKLFYWQKRFFFK